MNVKGGCIGYESGHLENICERGEKEMFFPITEKNIDTYYGSRLRHQGRRLDNMYSVQSINIMNARRARATTFPSRIVGRAPAYTLF